MVTYGQCVGRTAKPHFDDLAGLYTAVYTGPPYNEGPEQIARFREKLPVEASFPGFALVTAHTEGPLIGAAYGWTMPAGTWWSRADQEPSSELRKVDKFAVMEWIVHPGYQSHGVGRKLMHSLLADRAERWATLASNPESAARRMYERAGWQQVGTSSLPWGTPMELLVLDLHRQETSR